MKFTRWLITIAYAGFIFFLSSRTWSGLPAVPYGDKALHWILYFGLGGLLVWALRATALKGRPVLFRVAFLAALLYAASDEFHQLFVPGREFSLLDLLADAAGAMVGIFAATRLATMKKQQRVLI